MDSSGEHDEPVEHYARQVRALRCSAGLTQQDLAEASGVSRSTIQNIETRWVGVPRRATHQLIRQVFATLVSEKEVSALDEAYRGVRRQRLTKQAEWRQKWTA